MDIYNKLPEALMRKIFMHFRHPVADIVRLHWRSPQMHALLEDIRDYPVSLRSLYGLPFAKDHDGIWGRARLLNSLWIEAQMNCGTYYKIWERMWRINKPKTAEGWIRWRYAVNSHVFQIDSLWALFTKDERARYLERHM